MYVINFKNSNMYLSDYSPRKHEVTINLGTEKAKGFETVDEAVEATMAIKKYNKSLMEIKLI